MIVNDSLDYAVDKINGLKLPIDLVIIFSHNGDTYGMGLEASVARKDYWWDQLAQAAGRAPVVAVVCRLANTSDMSIYTSRTGSTWYATGLDVYTTTKGNIADKNRNYNLFNRYDPYD